MDDKEYQKKNLQLIYRDASLAPVFHKNDKYCKGSFENIIPFIAYDDVMDNKYIIRARDEGIINSFFSEKTEIVVKYESIDELVEDGWRLD